MVALKSERSDDSENQTSSFKNPAITESSEKPLRNLMETPDKTDGKSSTYYPTPNKDIKLDLGDNYD